MKTWQSPTIAVKWGSYFEPDPDEEQKIVQTTQEAMGSKGGQPIITLREAVQKVASVYGIENVEAHLTKLEEERDATADRELQATTAALDAEARAQRAAKTPPGQAA